MARYAVVKDGIVSNIILYDGVSEFSVDGDVIVDDGNAYIGGAYADGSFTPAPIPEDVSTYSSRRRYAYGSIEDQLDMQYWQCIADFSTNPFVKSIISTNAFFSSNYNSFMY